MRCFKVTTGKFVFMPREPSGGLDFLEDGATGATLIGRSAMKCEFPCPFIRRRPQEAAPFLR